MITVKIKAAGANLIPGQPIVTSGSIGSVRAEFEFDSEWQGLYKTAVFNTRKGTFLLTLENGGCFFPAEALSAAGDVKIGIFGTDGERTLTSLFCNVKISHGAPTDGETAANYAPGIYEQLYAKIARIEGLKVDAVCGDDADASFNDDGETVTLHLTLPRGEKGEKGDTGEQGLQGEPGKDGADGKDGYTPVRGVDYWTEADQNQIVQNLIYVGNKSYLCGVLSFASEDEFRTFEENDLWVYEQFFGGNHIIFISGIPKYLWIAEEQSYIPFASPMLDSEKDELKAYIDEAILGGEW